MYTREDVLKNGHCTERDVVKVENLARSCLEHGLLIGADAYLVLRFENVPEVFRKVCCFNGGDEDWMVLSKEKTEWTPNWLEHTDSCYEPDVYSLDGLVIYVGTHS